MTGHSLGVLATLTGLAALGTVVAAPAEETPDAKYVSDFSRCAPRSALTRTAQHGHWQVIPYETLDPHVKSGKMIGAASFMEAPDVKLPIGATGWHRIYVGYWNPFYAYDGGTTVKVRLSDDPAFTRIAEPEPPGDLYGGTSLHEAFFTTADLTGRDIVFGKVSGPFGQKAYIAYVKLVPLPQAEVVALEADRARTDTRRLEATIDGISYFWANEYRTKEQLLELVERYRHSDVGKVIWAACYGDATNYPSKVGTFYGVEPEVPIQSPTNSYIAGEKAATESLRSLVERGLVPQAVVAQRVHEMGLKFDLMLRLGIGGVFDGTIPPMRRTKGARGFVVSRPECRQVLADGMVVEKASYAYPEVRNEMLALIREATETFDVDGANLCFIRGPQFLQYEKPIRDAFREQYGEDATKVAFDDPRMRSLRCAVMTDFVRDVRRTLDRTGRRKGKKLELSAWVFGSVDLNLSYGLDIIGWINEGLLDSILIQAVDPNVLAAARAHHCRIIDSEYSGEPERLEAWVANRDAGADGLAIWDMDSAQDSPTRWEMLRRSGHAEEVKAFVTKRPELPTVKLKTVGGADVDKGLFDAAYSAG